MNTVKPLPVVIGVCFVLASVFGISAAMEPDKNGNMPGCPFMAEQASFCSMGLVAHITQWQQIFAATLLLFVVFAALLTATTGILRQPAPKAKWSEQPDIRALDPLRLAFSKGILNSKIYEAATF